MLCKFKASEIEIITRSSDINLSELNNVREIQLILFTDFRVYISEFDTGQKAFSLQPLLIIQIFANKGDYALLNYFSFEVKRFSVPFGNGIAKIE